MDDNQFDDETIAPGMNTHNELEEKTTDKEVQEGESTSVTRQYLDRTPKD
ncbi:hypothetical protein [Paenibacillus cremeus]|nr:hypothetical protein [Paenibacillus cremeus]